MKIKKYFLVGFLVVVSGYAGFLVGEQKLKFQFRNWKPAVVVNKTTTLAGGPTEVDFASFWTVWERVSKLYVDKSALSSKKMVDGAIAGMVAAIGDPYTAYLPLTANKASKEDLGGAFEGVGIQLGFDKDGLLTVVTPLQGTPAQKAGVMPGDLIAKIDTKLTDGISLQEAVNLIRGPKGTKVELTLLRIGLDKPIVLDMTRETIIVKSVTVEFKDDVAWLKLTKFGDKTQDEWTSAITAIVAQKSKGVVLDLRNNPGGYLEGSVYVAGEFISAGKVVVWQQYGDGTRTENKVERNGRLLNTPLVVLINKGSASASEILSGALQDHKRAKVVGEQSFGKGSVQQPEDFPDGSGIHVTIAKWLRPSGDWIDKIGIMPDVKVEAGSDQTKDPQLDKAIEMLK